MIIEVLIVQTEGEGGYFNWVEGGSAPTQGEWRKAALGMARRANDQRAFRADIFLCLKADYLVHKFDYDVCNILSEAARNFGWGAKLYIAVDETLDIKPEQLDNIPFLITWLKGINNGQHRATDIVLANFNRVARLRPPYHFQDLQRARDESMGRYDMLPGMIIPDQWYCWAASKEYQPWLADVSPEGAENLIIVIKDSRGRGSSSRAVKRAVSYARERVEALPKGRFVLGCLGREEPSEDVVRLGWKHKIPILRFRGFLELRYFLMRLNRLCQGQAALAQTVEAVPVERQVFRVGSRHRPRLLITSSFNPDTHEINCLDAVRDVGAISRAAPAQAEYYVQPYFRAADFPDLLKRMPELTAWLHLGHGDEAGLKDVTGSSIKLDEWFARLRHFGASLPLIFLSVCESVGVARKFAEAGVGVAIGFEREVLPDMCREMAVPIVSAALSSGGSRRAVLEAYNGVVKDSAGGAAIFRPKAFYSVI
jgi:hypothetical protein